MLTITVTSWTYVSSFNSQLLYNLKIKTMLLNLQRLGGPTNPPTADQAIHARDSNTSQNTQDAQATVQEDMTPIAFGSKNLGVGRVEPAWQPGLGCQFDAKSPPNLKHISEEKAQRIIKNIENEQAAGLKQGLRLEKTQEKRVAGWDMFSDQDQDLKVSFMSVMYQPVYVPLLGSDVSYGTIY